LFSKGVKLLIFSERDFELN